MRKRKGLSSRTLKTPLERLKVEVAQDTASGQELFARLTTKWQPVDVLGLLRQIATAGHAGELSDDANAQRYGRDATFWAERAESEIKADDMLAAVYAAMMAATAYEKLRTLDSAPWVAGTRKRMRALQQTNAEENSYSPGDIRFAIERFDALVKAGVPKTEAGKMVRTETGIPPRTLRRHRAKRQA